MTRAGKRDVNKGELRRTWKRQALDLGFRAEKVRANARRAERERLAPDLFAGPGYAAGDAATCAVQCLSERQAVFGHADLLAATLERDGGLHAATGLDYGRHWTTDAAIARESETIALMRAGRGVEKAIMRPWVAETKLRRGRLNEGQKEAVKTILASTDRVSGVQGYTGTGKTTILKRLRVLVESRGYDAMGVIRDRKLTPRITGYQRFIAPIGVEPARQITAYDLPGSERFPPGWRSRSSGMRRDAFQLE